MVPCCNSSLTISKTESSVSSQKGFILGPLLFLVFINGIVEEINSSIRLSDDDNCLYIVVNDPLDSVIK